MSTEVLNGNLSSEMKTEDMTDKIEQMQESVQMEVADQKTKEEARGRKERYEQLIAKYCIPNQEKFIHKREQMYLMVEQMLSEAFIGKVIDYSSQTIDRLRLAVFVAGEEYVMKQLSDQEPSQEQIREWIDDYERSTIASSEIKPVNSSIEKSLDIMGRYMVRQQEIASKQLTRLTEYIKKINDLERVKNEQDLRNLRAKHQKEQEEAQMQISLLSDENFRLSMKLEDAHEEAKKLAEEAKKQVEEEKKAAEPAMPSVAETTQDHPGHETGIFARQRMNREEKRREAFITSVLGNGAFSKEQLTVINRVVSKKFSLSQLQKICDPKVKPENMELLEAYYERRQTSERL